MQARARLTLPRATLIPLALVTFAFLALSPIAPAQAADAAIDARPAAARDVARRDTERHAQALKVISESLDSSKSAVVQEPLRDLIDKYAPSAIEWSMLPHLARSSKPVEQQRSAAAS